MEKRLERLKRVFEPRTIAIIGASETPGKVGNVVVRNFLEGKFVGRIYPINPKWSSVLGLKCYNNIKEVPGSVDCVIVAAPAQVTIKILKSCAVVGVGGVIVLSGGFEEVGRVELSRQMRIISEKYEMPIIGPNCLGIFNPYNKVDSIFLPQHKLERPKPGSIAFVTQSGAVGSVIMDLASHYGIGVSKFISYGNATAMDENDYLEFLRCDKLTKTIILYIEGTKDGRRLLDVMKKVNRTKPIIALKAGKWTGGQQAARSHTGNIAGSYMAYNAAFKQARVTEADSISEVFDIVKIYDKPKPKGKKIGVVTNGGGLGVLTADHIETEGLELAKFSALSKNKLKRVIPEYGNVSNPLDLVADADVEAYRKSIDILLQDNEVDCLIIIVLTQTPLMDERIIDIITKASELNIKPIAAVMVGGDYTERYRRILSGKGVATYDTPQAAVKAIKKFLVYSNYVK